jgi:hypothetical protein
MRRITIWVTATLSVIAIGTYYQVSRSGDGKQPARQGAPANQQTGKPGEHK